MTLRVSRRAKLRSRQGRRFGSFGASPGGFPHRHGCLQFGEQRAGSRTQTIVGIIMLHYKSNTVAPGGAVKPDTAAPPGKVARVVRVATAGRGAPVRRPHGWKAPKLRARAEMRNAEGCAQLRTDAVYRAAIGCAAADSAGVKERR